MINFFKKNEGFTIIELAISSSILIMIFGGMTIFGVQVIKNYNRTRAIKNTMENVSFAIESINKTIRTSNHIDSSDDDKIFIIDNNTGNSYCYFFDDNKLKRRTGNSSATSCSDIGGTAYDLVGTDDMEVDGVFKMKETNVSDAGDKARGFVRTTMKIKYVANAQDKFVDDEIIVQSGVSLRDYGYYYDE